MAFYGRFQKFMKNRIKRISKFEVENSISPQYDVLPFQTSR